MRGGAGAGESPRKARKSSVRDRCSAIVWREVYASCQQCAAAESQGTHWYDGFDGGYCGSGDDGDGRLDGSAKGSV